MPQRQEMRHDTDELPNETQQNLISLEKSHLGSSSKRASEGITQGNGKRQRNSRCDKLYQALPLEPSNLEDKRYREVYRLAKLEALQHVRTKVGIDLDRPFTYYTKMEQQNAEREFRACLAKEGNKLGSLIFCSCWQCSLNSPNDILLKDCRSYLVTTCQEKSKRFNAPSHQISPKTRAPRPNVGKAKPNQTRNSKRLADKLAAIPIEVEYDDVPPINTSDPQPRVSPNSQMTVKRMLLVASRDLCFVHLLGWTFPGVPTYDTKTPIRIGISRNDHAHCSSSI